MQLTIQQLKTAVLEHVSADWVRENFGKLTLKSTWRDAYDRTREYAAAKLEQATEAAAGYAWAKVAEVVEDVDKAAQYVQDFNRDDAVHLALTGTAMIARLAKQSIELLVMAGVFCWFLAIELKESGSIDRTLARMGQIKQGQEVERLIGVKPDPTIVAFRSPMLASSIQIAA